MPGLNRKLLTLGTPILFQDVIISVGGLVVQFVVNGYGFLFVAGFTATNKLYGILEMAAISYGYAIVTYVGQNLGAEKITRIKRGVRASAVLAFLTSVFKIDSSDMLLIALFGGVLYGLGLGLIMKSGFTLGGTDFLTQIVNKYFKLTLGSSMILVEGTIVVIGAFIFGFTNFMYAAVILYLITFLVDKVVLGISDKKAFYVVTKNKKKVCDYIINELGHTVTIFSATGGFSKKKTPVLFTVIPTKEYYKLKEGIKYIDNNAFFTVVDAYEVTGGE